MPKLPHVSGIEVTKALCNKFNFRIINRKGSHITLINDSQRHTITVTLVAHKEVRKGTLRQIIAESHVGRKAFMQEIVS
jgi:predicted RNA binding protein YcfA (HicA-like mRNA interferase family)